MPPFTETDGESKGEPYNLYKIFLVIFAWGQRSKADINSSFFFNNHLNGIFFLAG